MMVTVNDIVMMNMKVEMTKGIEAAMVEATEEMIEDVIGKVAIEGSINVHINHLNLVKIQGNPRQKKMKFVLRYVCIIYRRKNDY